MCNYIPDDAFQNKTFTNNHVIKLNNIKYIGNNAFKNCNLSNITIIFENNQVERIGDNAFEEARINVTMKLGNTFNKLGSSCFNSFQGKLNFDCKSEHISNTGANTFTNITLENSPESNISFDLKSDNKNYTIGLNCFKNIKDIPININFNDSSDNDTILNLEANCFENFTGILNLN